MAGGLAARRVDQPPQRLVLFTIKLAAGKDARVAQKALEPLMRRGLPAIEGAAPIRIDTRSLDADEELPPLLSIAELGDGPCWLRSVVSCSGRATSSSSSGMAGPPGAPATWRASQPSTCSTKAQGSREGGLGRIRFDQLGDRACIDRTLPQRGEPQPLEEAGGDDKPDRLNMVQPFEVGVAIEVCGHGDHPETGQR